MEVMGSTQALDGDAPQQELPPVAPPAVTWTGGQSTTELSGVQGNVPVEAAKFGKPAAPVAPK